MSAPPGLSARRRLGMAAAFGRSLLAWNVDGEARPVSASFAVTNRCNLRCSYCNTPFLDPSHLSLEHIDLLFERLRSAGVQRLGVTGGEPLLRKDIGEILAMAHARGFYLTLNSNLQLLDRRRDALRHVHLFFTSLDGDRAQHEAARGEGSWDGVLDGIASLTAEGHKVVAICVVTEHNLDPAPQLLDIAERLGFRVHFQPQCTDTAIVRGALDASLTNDRLRGFWRRLLVDKQAGRPIASSALYLEELADWDDFSRTAVDDPAARCVASRAFLYVDPQGHAYPCAYTKGKVDPVDMLGDDWRRAFGRDLPCTRCSVGPYLEFNLLYRKPVRSMLSALRSYL